jgi:hypothetical protein
VARAGIRARPSPGPLRLKSAGSGPPSTEGAPRERADQSRFERVAQRYALFAFLCGSWCGERESWVTSEGL